MTRDEQKRETIDYMKRFNTEEGEQLGLMLRYHNQFGNSLFASKFIDPKVKFDVLTGEYLTKEQFDDRYTNRDKRPIYVVYLPYHLRQKKDHIYLDCTDVRKSNYIRFSNQPGKDEQPNCIVTNRELKLKTNKLILPGQQLIWDYANHDTPDYLRQTTANMWVQNKYIQTYGSEILNGTASALNEDATIDKTLVFKKNQRVP